MQTLPPELHAEILTHLPIDSYFFQLNRIRIFHVWINDASFAKRHFAARSRTLYNSKEFAVAATQARHATKNSNRWYLRSAGQRFPLSHLDAVLAIYSIPPKTAPAHLKKWLNWTCLFGHLEAMRVLLYGFSLTLERRHFSFALWSANVNLICYIFQYGGLTLNQLFEQAWEFRLVRDKDFVYKFTATAKDSLFGQVYLQLQLGPPNKDCGLLEWLIRKVDLSNEVQINVVLSAGKWEIWNVVDAMLDRYPIQFSALFYRASQSLLLHLLYKRTPPPIDFNAVVHRAVQSDFLYLFQLLSDDNRMVDVDVNDLLGQCVDKYAWKMARALINCGADPVQIPNVLGLVKMACRFNWADVVERILAVDSIALTCDIPQLFIDTINKPNMTKVLLARPEIGVHTVWPNPQYVLERFVRLHICPDLVEALLYLQPPLDLAPTFEMWRLWSYYAFDSNAIAILELFLKHPDFDPAAGNNALFSKIWSASIFWSASIKYSPPTPISKFLVLLLQDKRVKPLVSENTYFPDDFVEYLLTQPGINMAVFNNNVLRKAALSRWGPPGLVDKLLQD
ncbi:UNVERIFIED_CONTAM: hypothetical protein HDU68_005397, partial [Siphonaria sp. JEL0065]